MSRPRQPSYNCSGCPMSHCPAHCFQGNTPPERPKRGWELLRLGALIIFALVIVLAMFSRSTPAPIVSATNVLIGTATLRATAVPSTPTITADALALNTEGLRALAREDQSLAAAQFSAAIAADPAYYEPYNNLAFVRYEQGRDDEAIWLWHEALQLWPESADANAGMGMALAAKGQLDEAWTYYRRALNREPRYADAAWMQQARLWGVHAIMRSAPLRQRAQAQ